LAGRVALVTGGGTNLGKAAAAELVRCGAAVVIAGRRADVLAAAAVELGEGCSWVAADIRERTGAEMIVGAAGITAKGWAAVNRLNVSGTLTMCETAHRLAMGSAGGTIVNVTVSPHHGFPAMAHTGAARAAVEALTRELAERWAQDGVAVLAVALGRLATESLRKYPAELWQRAAESVPLQRLGEVEEYGWLVALLAGPMGRALSGSVVTLDGALDNWSGPWPPPDLSRDGAVPTEERRPAAPTRSECGPAVAPSR
jgi:citronellol/citronellal dehydrogenase